MTAKKTNQVRTRISAPTPKATSDKEFSFSQDALNLATEHLPPGYQVPLDDPDAWLFREERSELLEKSIPKILGDKTDMAWVFVLMVFKGKSIQDTANFLKAISGKKYPLGKIKTLYTQALGRVAALFDETAKKIRKEERMEKAKRRHGQIH